MTFVRFGAVDQGYLDARDCKRNRKESESVSEQERVAGGPLGKAVGRAKQLAGAALGRDDLGREGRLQEAQAETEVEAAERAAEAERKDEQAQIEAERAEVEAERHEVKLEAAQIEAEEQAERKRAEEERLAAAEKGAATQDAAELRREADRAEAAAEALDRKED